MPRGKRTPPAPPVGHDGPVGTVLFAINQLDVVLGGHATWVTWVKAGVTCLVPFAVANVGVLIGTRVR